MSSTKMIKTMYKSMFKLAQKFDKNMPAKTIIYRLPGESTTSDSVFRSESQLHFNATMDKILGRNRLFFHPTRMDLSMKSIVRKEFRNSKSKVSVNSRLDVGFSLFRQFSTLWAIYDQETKYMEEIDHVMLEYQLTSTSQCDGTKKSSKVKSSSKLDVTMAPVTIQAGVVLAAHPMVHGDMHRSLVLVVEHNESYSYGVMLNKAGTQQTLRSGVSGVQVEGFYKAFGNNPLFFGGNVRRLSHMHNSEDCAGIPIENSKTKTALFMHGSIEKAICAVNSSDSDSDSDNSSSAEEEGGEEEEEEEKKKKTIVKASDFYFFAGACVWEAGHLQRQVLEGTWVPLLAPVDKLLHLTLQERDRVLKNAATAATNASGGHHGPGLRGKEGDEDEEDGFGDLELEEDEREQQNRVWGTAMLSASRNCAQLASVPFTLHSACVEPLAWTGDDTNPA